MILKDNDDVVLAPDVQECSVDYVGKGALGVISDGGSNNIGVSAPSPKPALTTSEVSDEATSGDLTADPMLPFLMRWEGTEVHGLKCGHEF